MEKEFVESDKKGYTRIFLSKRDLIIGNFLGGLAWGLGTFIGATVVVAIAVWLFGLIGGLPLIGQSITDTINHSIRQIDTSPLIEQIPNR